MTSLNAITPKAILAVDALTCGAMAALLLAVAGPLGDWLDLPVTFLHVTGAVLVPWTLLLAFLATRPSVPRLAMIDVIAVNLLWVAGSVILLFGDWVEPNAPGIAFVIVQAVAVCILAAIQAELLGQTNDARPSRVARA
jgi:hypothetical protein